VSQAEKELLALTDAAGMHRPLVEALLDEIKNNAVEADNAFENEVGNLRNAKNEAVEALQTVIYNLRNA
jgi:hypothetical protein